MVLLHIKKADDLQMLVQPLPPPSLPPPSASDRLYLPPPPPPPPSSFTLLQVEVPAATPLSEAIPHVAGLWNMMLKMRKLADCCNDLAT